MGCVVGDTFFCVLEWRGSSSVCVMLMAGVVAAQAETATAAGAVVQAASH